MNNILEVMDSHGAQDKITDLSEIQQKEIFRKNNNEIFSTLAKITDSKFYGSRITDEIHKNELFEQNILVEILIAVGISSFFALPSHIHDISILVKLSSDNLIKLVKEHLDDVVYIDDNNYIKYYHSYFGERLVKTQGMLETAPIITEYLKILAPFMNLTNNSKKEFSRLSLGKELMQYRHLYSIFSPDSRINEKMSSQINEIIESIYESVRLQYINNYRFWEQRALCASYNEMHDEAESYARKAVALKRDFLTLTTLGKILLVRAEKEKYSDLFKTLLESDEILFEALENSKYESTYPHSTFFSHFNKIIPNLLNLSPDDISLLNTILNKWILSIDRLVDKNRKEIIKLKNMSILTFEKKMQNS
ncbi:hypothetical protein [Rothia amarae]|uniref:hypothetical protein n=1 Tax=Rothia amarae TaxID=169480 RepID=UPI0031D2920E